MTISIRRKVRRLARRIRAGAVLPQPNSYRGLRAGPSFAFVHINKTGGTSIGRALGLWVKHHQTARELRARIGERRWQAAFRFAFVRNPWDKVVSHYAYRVKTDQTGMGGGDVGFEEWVRLAYQERDPRYRDQEKMFQPQVDWLRDEDGVIRLHFVGRFERIEEDFRTVAERLKVRARLGHLNPSRRRPYREYHTEETVEIVRRHFAADIEEFGYEY
jgi:hypothetical protein